MSKVTKNLMAAILIFRYVEQPILITVSTVHNITVYNIKGHYSESVLWHLFVIREFLLNSSFCTCAHFFPSLWFTPIRSCSVPCNAVTLTDVKRSFTMDSPRVESLSVPHAQLSLRLLNPPKRKTTDKLTSLPGSRRSKVKVMDANKWPI